MPLVTCPNCTKLFDFDGFVEHSEETLFYCECGKIYEMSGFLKVKEVPKTQVDLSDIHGYPLPENTYITPSVSRGIFIRKTRWKKSHLHSHFFLYAKGYYEIGDVIEDLKKIQSHTLLIPVECITDDDVLKYLISVVIESLLSECQNDIAKIQIDKLILLTQSFSDDFINNTGIKLSVINKLLAILRHTQIFEFEDGSNEPSKVFINLCKPDPNILPLDNTHGCGCK